MSEPIPPEVLAARSDISRLAAERNAIPRDPARAAISAIDLQIGALLDKILPVIDPCDASEAEPLVLLPVRLETRFTDDKLALRVRIYPDEIHVDDLDRGLTPDEINAGEAYWTSVWGDPTPENAWPDFVAAVKVDRAEWVAHACTPTNLAARGSAPPAFPNLQAGSQRNIVARALPDRFVVLAIQNGQVSRAVGRPIPRDLSLSPIPLDAIPPLPSEGLRVPVGTEWLIDYERAVDVGMGVTVTLTGGDAPIERVIAVGTHASSTPVAAADELEDLLTGHRFGAGLGLLAQGTPTNNADGERSPYRARKDPKAPPLTPPHPQVGSDTSAAAALLGIDPAILSGLVGDGSGEQTIARQVNTALWAPGWGDYLSRLDDQAVPGADAKRESARGLFRDHVRGRGCAPAIRIGAQPYGVLPVSDLRTWAPQTGETTAGIVHIVQTLLERWRAAVEPNVPKVRTGQADLDEMLLKVLGSSPVMQGLRVRPVISEDMCSTVSPALGLSASGYMAEAELNTAVMAELLGTAASSMRVGSLHDETRPLPLPLASERDPEFIKALLGTPLRVLPVDSVLQALLVLSWQSVRLDVAKACPTDKLSNLLDSVELDRRLREQAWALIRGADRALPRSFFTMVARLQRAGISVGGPSMLRKYQPVEKVQTSLAEIAQSLPSVEGKSVATAALAWWFLAMGSLGEVRAAMQALTTTDLAARQLAVAEALDCSSHRLDAWATAIVSERRALQGANGARGLTIGAYGVIENLHPQSAGDPQNAWIHAPSTRHAIAAGMLCSSYLSHRPTSGTATEGGPFAIDLSSRRIQSAAHVIDGVRQGQQLGALLGYQIERGLAEAGLARLQLSLRTIAPLVARRLHDSDGADPPAAKEAVAATAVVDGVLLLKLYPPGDKKLLDALNVRPENVYLGDNDWPELEENTQWGTVTEIMRKAADTIDAVADVMLSESIMQLAGGNPHRAAAAMDAMSTGLSPSDTLDILEAQDSGERLTHRVLAVVGTNLPFSAWNANRPRARVEPRMEAWAAAHLGDPANVVLCEVGGRRITLKEAGFAALDLVYASDIGALERTLRVAVPDLGDLALAVARDPSWPKPLRALGQVVGLATTLRATIAGSHSLSPLDLTRPGEATRVVNLDDLTARVSTLAKSFVEAVAELEATIATIPQDGIVADASTATALAREAYGLEPFGVSLDPNPNPKLSLDVSWVRDAWRGAHARSLRASACVAQLKPEAMSESAVLDLAQEAASAVFGDGFLVVPLLGPGSGADAFVEAMTLPAFVAPPPSVLRRFVRDISTVRKQVMRLSEVLLLGGALGNARALEVVQLSERNAPGTTHWLAGPLPANGPWPASPVIHLVLDRIGTVDAATAVAGLVIDAWVEALPAQVGPKADPNDPRPGRARTGLAIRCNSASARPPQAVLCAVSPDGKRWTTESLRGLIEHTLDLARARMVTHEHLLGEGLVLPALYMRSSSLQGEQYLDFSELAGMMSSYVSMPFVKEKLS